MFNPKARVDSAMYVLEKKTSENQNSIFIKLNDIYEGKRKIAFDEIYEDLINTRSNKLIYSIDQNILKIIKSWPFTYWISDQFRSKLQGEELRKFADAKPGLQTGNNLKFLRYWWEIFSLKNVAFENIKWHFYAKGGPYEKWWGNLWTLVYWENNGFEIKNYTDVNGKLKSRPQNEAYYHKYGITYSALGGKHLSFRILPNGCIFDVGGASIFNKKNKLTELYLIAILNSILTRYILGCLNPTVNIQAGDIQRIPIVIPGINIERIISYLSERNVKIKKSITRYSIIENTYTTSPLLFALSIYDLRLKIKDFFAYENDLITQVLINEAIINSLIFDVYELTPEDKAMVLAKEGESIGAFPVLPEARAAYLSETEVTTEFPLDKIFTFIESLPTTTMTGQERADLTAKFETLYQSNNDLEEFCIRNQINPINVWYLFKKSGVLPQQRAKTIAMEFLADLIREILNEDDDGIVPLVRNTGEEILIDRIEKKFEEKGLTSAQFAAFPTILGKEINDYINNNFFADLSDHLNLFMYLPKTPFIWHITSGPRQGFDAFIIIYKWSRDKLFTLKSVYIEKRETALRNRQSDLLGEKSAQAEEEKDTIFHQLKEIESLRKKIDELLSEGYDPKLDDGVGKNIAPLQKRGIIAYEVLNPGQLKKYLNADW